MIVLTSKILLLLFSCNVNFYKESKSINDDSLLIEWNSKTIISLEKRQKKEKNKVVVLKYKNHTQAFKSLMGISSKGGINTRSIRSKFVSEILNNFKAPKYFIVEEFKSGEEVSVYNYIIFQDSIGEASVIKYRLLDTEWKLNEFVKKTTVKYNQLKLKTETSYGKGVNTGVIIITKFDNGKVVDSDYYLEYTLSSKSDLSFFLK